MNLFFVIYIAQKPLVGKLSNRLELLNETVIFGSTMHLIFFTEEYITDEEVKYELGWFMLACIAINMAVHLSIVFYVSGR